MGNPLAYPRPPQSRKDGSSERASEHRAAPDLQEKDEVVHGFVALVEVALGAFLVLLIVLELLDDIGVL